MVSLNCHLGVIFDASNGSYLIQLIKPGLTDDCKGCVLSGLSTKLFIDLLSLHQGQLFYTECVAQTYSAASYLGLSSLMLALTCAVPLLFQ